MLLLYILKIDNRATLDVTNFTRASLSVQTVSQTAVSLIIILYVQLRYNKCSDTLSFTKIIHALVEVLKNLDTLTVKEVFMFIINIHKKTVRVIRL